MSKEKCVVEEDSQTLGNYSIFNDGIHQQRVLLDQLSQKLDEYFAIRVFKSDAWAKKAVMMMTEDETKPWS